MPNHIHLLVYVDQNCKNLNLIIGESKRFMAYELVKRLKNINDEQTLNILSNGVQPEERKKASGI